MTTSIRDQGCLGKSGCPQPGSEVIVGSAAAIPAASLVTLAAEEDAITLSRLLLREIDSQIPLMNAGELGVQNRLAGASL
jgi:hypothetical protein